MAPPKTRQGQDDTTQKRIAFSLPGRVSEIGPRQGCFWEKQKGPALGSGEAATIIPETLLIPDRLSPPRNLEAALAWPLGRSN